MQKIENALIGLFVKVQLELMKLEQEEDGMEMLEAIILMVVAVAIAAVIINALGDENGGLIGTIWTKISDKLDDLF